jgi:eukaryotic-like serine/threonine-protein kinase
MGTVYVAEHTMLGSLAAIKVLQRQHLGDPAVVQRFFNEARAASAIRHLGIVEIFDVGHLNDGTSFIVMELLRGETLGARLARGGLPLAQVISVVAQMASALAAAHRAGVVHRDLKPDNIFLLDDPGAPAGLRVKLLDFGVAKLTGGDRDPHLRTAIGIVLGTPDYMSPEQVRGEGTVDHRADLYALGCLMFRLLTGVAPYRGELADVMYAHVMAPPPSIRAIDPRLPAELEHIVQTLMAKDPKRRPSSADHVVAALGALGGGTLMSAVSTPLVPIARPPRTSLTTLTGATGARIRPRAGAPRGRFGLFALAAVVIAAAGTIGLWLGRRDRDPAHAFAKLPAPHLAPLTAPLPIPDAELDAIAPVPAPAPAPAASLAPQPPPPRTHHHHHAHHSACLSAGRPRRAGSASPRGRSPC